MKYSCKVITCGRVHLLEEAIFSFLNQQSLDGVELIIINDCPFQTLYFNHPLIKIFNEPLFSTIGDKENFAISKCNGDVIIVWDDDDIALSNHIDNISYYLKNNNLLFWEKGYFFNEPDNIVLTDIGNSGIVYTKDIWEKIGRSPIENAGGDMTLVNKIIAEDKNKVIYAFPKNPSWIYRWASPLNYHQSGQGSDVNNTSNIIERNLKYITSLKNEGKIPSGDIYLKPKWRYNYNQLIKKCK